MVWSNYELFYLMREAWERVAEVDQPQKFSFEVFQGKAKDFLVILFFLFVL